MELLLGGDVKMLEKEIEMPKELYEMANKEYDCKWPHGKVKIKRFLFKELSTIQNTAIKIKGTAGIAPSFDVNPVELKIQTILKGVLDSPWGSGDIGAVNTLPPFIADWVFGEIDAFNSIDAKKKG